MCSVLNDTEEKKHGEINHPPCFYVLSGTGIEKRKNIKLRCYKVIQI